jgi:large subunit ribosomal protein L30
MADIKIKLVRSGIGRPQRHKNTLKALGLTKMHRVVTKPDNPAVRGMIHQVRHLVEVLPS